MSKHQKLGGNALGRIILGSAIIVLIVGTPLFLTRTALAADAGYLRIVGFPGMDGSSKDPAHMNWTVISTVVSADLNGDATADRESSAPSVSELTAKPMGGTSAPSSGKSASDSWSAPTNRAAIGSSTSGAGAGKVTTSDAASALPTGKRMHKPFTITKEIDKSSPLLTQACVSGKHIPQVDVDLGNGQRYTLTDVMVSSVQKSGGSDRPMETVSFTYQKIEMTR